jgi:hypothetical protein
LSSPLRISRALAYSTLLVVLLSIAIYVQAPQPAAMFLWLLATFPPAFLETLGFDLGKSENGFFLPTKLGYVASGFIYWFAFWLLISLFTWLQASSKRGSSK